MAMRINYMEELDSLRRSVKEMGEAVEASFDQLLSAVDSKDEDLEMRIISGDRVINDMERNIESRCLSLITRQQPIAGDLRMISAALKVVTDIERIGDQTADYRGADAAHEGERAGSLFQTHHRYAGSCQRDRS